MFFIRNIFFLVSELGKKSTLHNANQCFARFGVSMMLPKNSVHTNLFNDAILRFSASGLDLKIANDMLWDLQQSDIQQSLDTTKSKTLSMSDVGERKLNLADTEGMFLLMAVGYILAGSVLISEIVGGCAKSCRAFIRRNSDIPDDLMRRGSDFSWSQLKPKQSKTFTDKLKREIRKRLRSKSKSTQDENQTEKTQAMDEIKSADELSQSKKLNPLNGLNKVTSKPSTGGKFNKIISSSISFCTLKRIMWMRKEKNDEQNTENETKEMVVNVNEMRNKEPKQSNFENYPAFEEEGDEIVTIKNEKTNSDTDDSLMGSLSINSGPHMIREKKTIAEINYLTVSNRENNPSEEFGELVLTN